MNDLKELSVESLKKMIVDLDVCLRKLTYIGISCLWSDLEFRKEQVEKELKRRGINNGK